MARKETYYVTIKINVEVEDDEMTDEEVIDRIGSDSYYLIELKSEDGINIEDTEFMEVSSQDPNWHNV